MPAAAGPTLNRRKLRFDAQAVVAAINLKGE
jgi:transposase